MTTCTHNDTSYQLLNTMCCVLYISHPTIFITFLRILISIPGEELEVKQVKWLTQDHTAHKRPEPLRYSNRVWLTLDCVLDLKLYHILFSTLPPTEIPAPWTSDVEPCPSTFPHTLSLLLVLYNVSA